MSGPETGYAAADQFQLQADPDCRALAGTAVHGDCPVHHGDHFSDHPDPCAARRSVDGIRRDLLHKKFPELVWFHPDTIVTHFKQEVGCLFLLVRLRGHLQLHPASGRCIFDRIGEQQAQHLHDPRPVSRDDIIFNSRRQAVKFQIPGTGKAGNDRGDLLHHQVQSEFLLLERSPHRLAPAHVDDLIKGRQDLLAGLADPVGILHDFRRIIGVFHEQHDKAGDHIDRHVELLRQAGKEITRGAVDILGLPEHHLLEITLGGI